MSEQLIKLQARKETVDPARAGLVSGFYAAIPEIDVRSYMDSIIRYGMAQALNDNIQNTEGALNVRPVMVDKDLRDGSNVAIASKDWLQPVSGNFSTATGTQASAVVVYKSTQESRNDRKILIFAGVRIVGAGNHRTAPVLSSSAIIWRRTDVKLIDIWDLQILEALLANQGFSYTPIMYKRGDDADILFVPNARVAVSTSKVDRLQPIGMAVEPLGTSMTG